MAKEINSDLIRGNINTIILKALYSGDRYGYDIVKEIETKSHGQYTIKQPTLYSCLKRLESQGFVSSYWGVQSNGGRRKYFSLTEMGKEVFKQSQDDYEYSRTIIDKLISEDKYDLGEYVASSEEENDFDYKDSTTITENNAENNTDIDSETSEVIATDAVLDENNLPQQENIDLAVEKSADSESAEEADSQNDLKESAATESVANTDQLDSYWKSVDDVAEALKRKLLESDNSDTSVSEFTDKSAQEYSENITEDEQVETVKEQPVLDNSADLANIFEQASGNSSYFSDIQSNDVAASNNGASNFFSDFSDLVGASSSPSTTKTPYEPMYSDEDYPYSDYDVNVAQQLENELLPETKTPQPEFISYHDEKSVAAANAVEVETKPFTSSSNEYKDRLTGLIDKFGENNSDITKAEIENNATELNNKVQIRVFGNIVESARELGEEVKVRTNDVQSKREYVKFYFRDNFLRLFVNAIVFVIMLTESLLTYTLFKNINKTNGQYDMLIFALSVLIAVSLPIYAGIKFYRNPDSKRRLETNFRDSIVFRIVVMVLVSLLSFGINLFMGMPLNGDITNYLISLFLPIILSTNFLISALIFRAMYQLPYFSAKD